MKIHGGEVHRGGEGLDGLLTSARRRPSVAAHADGNSLSTIWIVYLSILLLKKNSNMFVPEKHKQVTVW